VVEYPVGVLVRTAAPGGARAFVELLLGPKGREILRAHGFRAAP
jgi:ABC-type molybdate transport system substrate-binding protein